MRIKTRVVCFYLMLILCGPFCVKADEISVCEEVDTPVDYGEILSIPDELKALIEQYRDSWKQICADQKNMSLSLTNVFSQAKEIESEFETIMEQEDRRLRQSTDSEARYDRARRVDTILRKKYPEFIPGFWGSYMDWNFFKPSMSKFSEAAYLGNDEDKAFFKEFSGDSIFPPWIQGTWDYGGCRLYGEFDWVKRFETALDFRERFKSGVYIKINSENIDGMIEELTGDYDICTCAEKESVLSDLFAVSHYLKDKAEFESVYKAINQRIEAIQSGNITVRSEAEKHCSGG